MKDKLRLFLEKYKRQIHEEAEKLFSLPMPAVTEELFSLFERNGNRLLYEEVYFTRRKFLVILGLQALLQKAGNGVIEDRTLQKLTEVIENICTEECWALPAHLSRKNPGWQLTIDLFAAETGQTLSELADRLKDDLPGEVYSLIVDNVERRVIHPFLSTESFGWEKSDHNWNAVCAGSIGSACLHLMKDKKEILKPCLDRICESLTYYIEGFADDGTCMEGLGYYIYGMSYFVNFAQELCEYTEGWWDGCGKIDLLCGDWAGFSAGGEDKRARIAAFYGKCFFADGRTVNFSDGSSKDKYQLGLGCALKRCFPRIQIPDVIQSADLLEDSCYRFVFRKMDIFETEKYLKQLEREEQLEEAGRSESVKQLEETGRLERVEQPEATGRLERVEQPKEPGRLEQAEQQEEAEQLKKTGQAGTGAVMKGEGRKGKCHILPDAQWCIASAQNGVGFACKGGHNGEPHNHNDVGHFIYESSGEILFADLGAGEYTREYFSEGRYRILCNNSFGHSVPIISRCGQSAGKEYGCSEFAVSEGMDNCVVNLELANAYEKGLLERFHRQLCFSMTDGTLEIEDEFALPEGKAWKEGMIEENLITQLLPRIQGEKILLEGEAIGAVLYIYGVCAEQDVTIHEYIHRNHQGEPEKVYAIRWQVPEGESKKTGSRFYISVNQADIVT